MVTLKITHQLEVGVSCIPVPVLQIVKQDLNVQFNLKKVQLYRIDNETGNIILPRGYIGRLIKLLRDHNTKYKIDDHRLLLPKVVFQSQIRTKDYQEMAIRKLIQWRQGGLIIPGEAGENIVLLEVMARIGQPSIWVTYRKDLAEQIIEQVCNDFEITKNEIGFIGDGNLTIGNRLTVALIQELGKVDIEQIKDEFGAIFIDGAQHMSATSLFYPIGQFPALYRFWGSDSPERKDNSNDLVFAACGPIIYCIDTQNCKESETNEDKQSNKTMDEFGDIVHTEPNKSDLRVVE